MRAFIESHWGDLIGLLLLYTGVSLVLWATCAGAAEPAKHLGESLVLAAMGVLKLRGERGPASAAGRPASQRPKSPGDDAQ
jgi:hypothetical protein